MKQMTIFHIMLISMILCLPFTALSEDNDIFGECGALLEPNILIIIDSSGSMNSEISRGKTRMDVAKEAFKDLVDDHADSNRFGIMRFHSNSPYDGGYIITYNNKFTGCEVKDKFILDAEGEIKTGQEYTDAIKAYKIHLKDAVDSISANGSTPLAETLFEAGRYFAGESALFNSGTYTSPTQYRCQKNYIVLITDGEPQCDHSIQEKQINGHNLTVSNNFPAEITDPKYPEYRFFYDKKDPELQDVAALLFEKDINSKLPGPDHTDYQKQNVITYTIGFGSSMTNKCRKLLQATADKGQGKNSNEGSFYDATNPMDLSGAFQAILQDITEQKTTFAAPIVPISDVSKAYAGDYVYISMFKPNLEANQNQWIGNLKKYHLNNNNEFASCDSDEAILDNDGNIMDNACSCWSNTIDGADVKAGGAGEKLLTNYSRTLYYDDVSDTSDYLKEFTIANLTPADFSFITTSSQLESFIDSIHMTGKPWKLLDLNHSKPAIADTGTHKYVFVGSNGGMLHCIDDTDGSELWGYIPKAQFNRLNKVNDMTDHFYFMDGSPTVAHTGNEGILVICGERRGGNRYYVLDVSDMTAPVYKYTHTAPGLSWKKPDFIRYRKTADPEDTVNAFLLTGGYDTRYDHHDDLSGYIQTVNNDNIDSNDELPVAGGSITIIKASDGTVLKTFDQAVIPEMNGSIVSAWAVDVVDDDYSGVTQIYAADMEGHVFALRDNDPAQNQSQDCNWQGNHLFAVTGASTGKKIFSELDFVREFLWTYDTNDTPETEDDQWVQTTGDFTYFGTGDREDPLDLQGNLQSNYFYCVKNDWQTQDLTVNQKVKDVQTLNDLNTDDEDEFPVIMNLTDINITDDIPGPLRSRYNRGWYIKLEGKGEKCLSTPLVYAGVVYFTTYTPPENETDIDPCAGNMAGGTAKLYAVHYKTGGAIYDFYKDPANTDPNAPLSKEDRSITLEQKNISIPPDPIIIITSKGDKLLIGPQTFSVKSPGSGINSFYWKGV